MIIFYENDIIKLFKKEDLIKGKRKTRKPSKRKLGILAYILYKYLIYLFIFF